MSDETTLAAHEQDVAEQASQVHRFAVSGMHCAGCVLRIEKALLGLPGVLQAAANLANETVQVVAEPSLEDQDLRAALAAAGYPAVSNSIDRGQFGRRKQLESKGLRRDALVAAMLTLPVFALEMGVHIWPGLQHLVSSIMSPTQNHVLQFLCISVVLFGPGRRFFSIGVPAMFRGAPDMNSLVAIGAFAAWAYSTVVTFAPLLALGGIFPPGTDHVYFEAAGVIVTLILLGRYLEGHAKQRAGDAVRALIDLQAKTARKIQGDEIVIVDVADLKVGHQIRVLPGDIVPADGLVVDGQGFVDESMLTGESAPVWKSVSAQVVGGTQNAQGALSVQVTQVGEQAALAHIIRLVENAQAAKLPVQKLVDQVTAWFVPAVMLVAVLTFVGWIVFGGEQYLSYAWVSAVAVLIVACPCALGLATPTSIVVATGRAAQLGIMFSSGDALERLSKVDVIAFDKTGTLTEGQPKIVDLQVVDGFEETQILSFVASLERLSEHPIGFAVTTLADERQLDRHIVDNFTALAGLGIRGEIGSHTILVGSAKLLRGEGVDLSSHEQTLQSLTQSIRSVVCVAIDGSPAAFISVVDPIKPSAAPTLAALQSLGLRVAIVSGDGAATVSSVAKELHIQDYVADVLPAGKISALDDLVRPHEVVAFVGDGINDAPVLAHADVGIALGSGTDVAMQSAQVVLLGGDLSTLTKLVSLSSATMRNIRQNLFWAFAYNTLLVPLAAGAFYPFTGWLMSPGWAAAAMALSSLFVLGNALRLKNFARS